MDKNTTIQVILMNKINEKNLLLDNKIEKLEKEIASLVSKHFNSLNVEESVNNLLSEIQSNSNKYANLLNTSSEEFKILVADIKQNSSRLSLQYKEAISKIKVPKDGYTPIKGKDYHDGKDYVLTADDIADIAEKVVVEIPELKDRSADEILELISGKIEISDIVDLDDRLKKVVTQEIITGGKTWYLKDLKDVDLSGLAKNAAGQYVLGSGGGGGGAVTSVNAQTGVVVLDKSDIGLSNVDNTSDINKPISTATQTALNLKANDSDVVKKTDYTPAHSILVQQSGTGSPTSMSVSNSTLIGRKSGGGSDIEDLSIADVISLLGLATVATSGDYSDLINTPDNTLISTTTISTSRSLLLTDKNTNIENSASVIVTVPTNASVAFPIGTQIFFTKKFATLLFVGAVGVTINSVDNYLEMDRINCGATLLKVGTDEWNLIGELK